MFNYILSAIDVDNDNTEDNKSNVLSGISQSDFCNHVLIEIWTSQGACCPSRLESVPVSGAAVTAPIISRNK